MGEAKKLTPYGSVTFYTGLIINMNYTLWPSPRPRNIAIAMENDGRITKPAGVRRWTHETAIDSLAEYGRMSRETLLATHPIDYIVRYMVAVPIDLTTLLPKEVVLYYRGPFLKTHRHLFNMGMCGHGYMSWNGFGYRNRY